MPKNKNKPCPFCGSHDIEYEFFGSQGYVYCNNCDASGPEVDEAADPECDVQAAYDAWNKRCNIEDEKMLDDYLDTIGYKPEKDVNGYREYVRSSRAFATYKLKIAKNNAFLNILKVLFRRKKK